MAPCRHCRRRHGYMARGLCGPCYKRPEVRGLYPPRPPGYAAAPRRLECRHCQREAASRKRGMCPRCYHDPEVRSLYPPSHRTGSGVGLVAPRRPAPEATDAQPGSEAKVAVLAARAEMGVRLWHPKDNRGS